ncbi:F-box/kelch-repeat protein [Raphanus sativus]|uniref:F-box/kelch-repeat protein At4g39580-like n=1 Tax=Raphanus sativus TaxID=3726 RepID=A0A6J0LHW6_RAPSA|nr:F-box/kelch-repeat protein At4g39580-like [Raphanus sativus]KAJ4898686.1 F-box/kelch-repeat protein [Raphanus sativus]
MNNEETPPHEQNEMVSPTTTSLSLPDDILLSFLNRISRLYYPTFSLVSKSFRSLIASPELYQTRSFLNRTESCLYACLRSLTDSNLRWLTLCRVPDRKLTNYSGGHLLVPVSSSHAPPPPPAHWSSVVAVGSNIYAVGGPINDAPSSRVSFLDCRSDTWRTAPPMLVARNYPTASVLDGKIYVAGGCEDCDSLKCIEVFDPNTQRWDSVASHDTRKCKRLVYKGIGIEGKFHLLGGGRRVAAYDPEEGRWDLVGREMDMGRAWVSYSVIKNVLVYYHERDREFKWYDYKGRFWRKLMGLERLIKFLCDSRVSLADYGGKMAVLWDTFVPGSGSKNKMIWCAEVSLERHDVYDVCGKIEWFDVVLRVSKSYELVHVVAATV